MVQETVLMFSVVDWLAVTTAIVAGFSPAYYYLWAMNAHMERLTGIIENCPYCTRRRE